MQHISHATEAILDRLKAQAERDLAHASWSPLMHLVAAQVALAHGLHHVAGDHVGWAAEKLIGDHL